MESNRLHFLITAGGTREYIDPVRFISNASSGKMGYSLAQAAVQAGHKVTLITTMHCHFERSPDISGRSREISFYKVGTAQQMYAAVKKYFNKCDCLIMAAAVSDYTPVRKSKIKIKKSNKNLIIKLKPTIDILKWAGRNKKNQIVAGFALEDKDLRKNAEKKLKDKNLDMIIANAPSAIGEKESTVHIRQKDKDWLCLGKADKAIIAKKIISLLCRGLL